MIHQIVCGHKLFYRNTQYRGAAGREIVFEEDTNLTPVMRSVDVDVAQYQPSHEVTLMRDGNK